jgi:putative endonuclease
MTRNQQVGKWGEQAAVDFLIGRGYEIIARNIRTPYGEIDIIAKKGGFLFFVEVKARTSKTFGPPEIAVTPRKQQHMIACAEYYAQQNEIDHWQIDVIAVEQGIGKPKITYIQNAIS